MNTLIPNFSLLVPEVFILAMACVLLMFTVFAPARLQSINYIIAQATLFIVGLLILILFNVPAQYQFEHMFVHDMLSSLLQLFIIITAILSLVYGKDYLLPREMPRGEYYTLALFAVLGMMVMVSSANLLTLYMGIELLSLPLYAMVAMRRDQTYSSEAGMKYFVMGAMASGLLLYGMSMLYGGTGSLELSQIAIVIAQTPTQFDLVMIFGMVFVIVGVAFKLGAAPFHMWVPDVYEGAPTAVTTFLSAAPKLAAFAVLARILMEALPHLSLQWHQFMILMAIVSMVIGNFAAIAQTNIKRMLAYSSIAHIGYMLLGLVTAQALGFSAALFYIIIYAIMSVGSFGLLALLSRAGMEVENLTDLKGLHERNPWLALMMLLMMFSMAGIPPTVGFFAKMGVLEALIHVGDIWLVVVALLLAVVGAYYYLRVVKIMYFDHMAKGKNEIATVVLPMDARLAISINGLAVLVLGLLPSGLINLCRAVFGI